MRNKYILLVIFLAIFGFNAAAQQDSTVMKMSGENGKSWFKLNSVSLSAGYYSPSMDYFNTAFLPGFGQTTDRFSGAIQYGANVSFDLPVNLGARVSASYWDKSVSGHGVTFNSLKVSLTTVSLGAFYTYNKGFMGLKPYAGIDGGALSIQNQYDANATVIKKTGNDITWTPFAGVKYDIAGKIVIGLEYGYVLGTYGQDFQLNSALQNHKISVEGSKILFSVGYKF